MKLARKKKLDTTEFERLLELTAQANALADEIKKLRVKLTTTLSTLDEKVVIGEFTFAFMEGKSSYTYSAKVAEMDALLKARKEIEKSDGTAKVTKGKPFMKITGGKK